MIPVPLACLYFFFDEDGGFAAAFCCNFLTARHHVHTNG